VVEIIPSLSVSRAARRGFERAPLPLFAELHTAETQVELPFMRIDTPEPIPSALSAAGFVDSAAEPRPDLILSTGVPCLITATGL